jgi:lysophospholipase L1-like esterase
MTDDPRARDDNRLRRFEQQGLNRFSGRQAVLAISIAALLLVMSGGSSVRSAGEQMRPGLGRDLVLAFGKPADWVASQLPLQQVSEELTAAVSADEELGGGGFDQATRTGGRAEVPPVTPQWFDPLELGEGVQKRPLDTLLVTGDSLSTPLDLEIARRLEPDGVEVIREPHLATGISNDQLADWGRLATSQVDQHHPDAVVVFIGANEGYPIPGPGGKEVSCCSPAWAATFANRARQMMDTYRQAGAARVYWLNVPTPRDPARAEIERAVNEAIRVAAQPWRSQIHLIDTVATFTPGDHYRDSMQIDGSEKIVRESDGIHLNEAGSKLAAEIVIEWVEREFTP